MSEIQFEGMGKKGRIEAFEVLLKSIDIVRPYGFDYVDPEPMIDMFNKLSPYKKRQIFKDLEIDEKVTAKNLEEKFYEAYDLPSFRKEIWYQVFKRANEEDQIYLLEWNRAVYTEALQILQKMEAFDWSQFTCVLESEERLSQLRMIKTTWSELGMQVYGCRTNHNGQMCPCLREATNTSAHKCFRDYLQRKGLTPDGAVPQRLLIER